MKRSKVNKDDEMIDHSYRIAAMAKRGYELVTQRNGKFTRRYHRYKTKQEAEAHANRWARRVKREERDLGRSESVIRQLTG
jgi:hypothetical protein